MNGDSMDLAAWLGVLKFVADQVEHARKKEYGAQFVKSTAPGARLPAKIGDQVFGWVSVPKVRREAVITDEDAYLAWAKEHHAGNIVEAVRESFTQLVLQRVKDKGGFDLDKDCGEYLPVPGVEIVTGDPYARAELDGNAEAVIRAAWQSGDLDLSGMLALPPAHEDGAAA